MPDTPSITIVKSFSYRGLAEEWSNTYHFTGTTPADGAGWKTLADALIAEERKIQAGGVSFIKAYGYAAGNESSVFQIDYREPPNTVVQGNGSTAGVQSPGDAAAWVRWSTTKRNSKGRPVYGRKYYHGIRLATGGGDTINTDTRTAMIALGNKLIDGSLPGGFKACLPQGEAFGAVKVPTYVTTRTLKRRGSDPS